MLVIQTHPHRLWARLVSECRSQHVPLEEGSTTYRLLLRLSYIGCLRVSLIHEVAWKFQACPRARSTEHGAESREQ